MVQNNNLAPKVEVKRDERKKYHGVGIWRLIYQDVITLLIT